MLIKVKALSSHWTLQVRCELKAKAGARRSGTGLFFVRVLQHIPY